MASSPRKKILKPDLIIIMKRKIYITLTVAREHVNTIIRKSVMIKVYNLAVNHGLHKTKAKMKDVKYSFGTI